MAHKSTDLNDSATTISKLLRLAAAAPVVIMSTHVVVVASNARTTKVKVNPNTYMLDVLEEACKQLNFAPDKWTLK